MRFVYDIEIYPNLFLVIFHNVETHERHVFETSPHKDQQKELYEFLIKKPELVGYNNLHFDYVLLYTFLALTKTDIKRKDLVNTIKTKANKIISGTLFKIPVLLPQIDLMKICHYDPQGAKATSLKMLEFVMRMENLQEIPHPHDALLDEDGIQDVIEYCHNDIDATLEFYTHCIERIELRENLTQKFPFLQMNYNDVKLGEQIIVNMLKQKMGVHRLGQTFRDSISFNEIIFPYVAFGSDELQRFLQWLKQQTVKETKGAFTRIELDRVESIKDLVDTEKKNTVKGMLKSLVVNYKDVQFTFGTGGIHQAAKNEIVESDDYYIIKSCDVKSMYPNIAIQNDLSPAHLGSHFLEIYLQIYKERLQHKKGTPINAAYKLSLNGSYGKANSQFSELYDPQWVLSITLNGQLLLCMLAEKLMEIEDSKLLLSNTDGLEILIPRHCEEEYMRICTEWERLTKLTLEYDNYKQLIIANVNNYIGIYENGYAKTKGDYELQREFHKNHSMLVVPQAVANYYLTGELIEDFIVRHDNVYDFFLNTKIKGKTTRLVIRHEDGETECQKITRYLITKEGGTLIKIMPPLPPKTEDREFNLQKGWNVQIYNDLREIDLEALKEQINYEYYINEANKLLINNEITESDSKRDCQEACCC